MMCIAKIEDARTSHDFGHSRRVSSHLIPILEDSLAYCLFDSAQPAALDSEVGSESLRTKNTRATVSKLETNPHRLSRAA
jgi:hypothetical protein